MASGVVVSFDLRKGFGFIRSAEFREDVFVHVTEVEGRRPLRSGQRVRFVAEASDRGPRATQVVPGRMGLSPTMPAAGLLLALLLGVAGGLHKAGVGWLGAYLGAIWAATWIAYAWDKRQAGLGERRVPETVLLGLALAGGSPAALVAMLVLRHKTRKASFLVRFGLVIATQAVAGGGVAPLAVNLPASLRVEMRRGPMQIRAISEEARFRIGGAGPGVQKG